MAAKRKEVKVGEIIGNWKVVDNPPGDKIICECQMCLGEKVVKTFERKAIFRNPPHSCGCVSKKREVLEVGTMFGYWKVIKDTRKGSRILCECQGCENKTHKNCLIDKLKSRDTQSCGCKKRERTENTCQEVYGEKCVWLNENIKKKSIETCLKKFGVSHPNKLESSKLNMKKKKSIQLSTGEYTYEIYERYSITKTRHALCILRTLGEEIFIEYCKNYKEKITCLEQEFIRIFKNDFPELRLYNKKPSEIEEKFSNKPDFRLERNGKVLYINVDGLYWHCEKAFKRPEIPFDTYHFDIRKKFLSHNLTLFQFRENEVFKKSEWIRQIVLNYFDEVISLPEDVTNSKILNARYQVIPSELEGNLIASCQYTDCKNVSEINDLPSKDYKIYDAGRVSIKENVAC